MPTGGGTTVCDAVLGIILLRFTTVVTPVIALVYTHSSVPLLLLLYVPM